MAPQAGDALLKAAEAADSRELVALYGRHVRLRLRGSLGQRRERCPAAAP